MKITVPEIVSAGMYNARIAYKGKSKSMNRKTSMFEIELPLENGGTSYINVIDDVAKLLEIETEEEWQMVDELLDQMIDASYNEEE